MRLLLRQLMSELRFKVNTFLCLAAFLSTHQNLIGATDAARAAADIVLTQPGLSTIVHGIVLARKIFARIRSFLTYRIAATLQLLVFFFIAVLSIKPRSFMPEDWRTSGNFPDQEEWPEYFHMPVLMLMLITLLNDGTLISIGYDNVQPRNLPEKWNLQSLYCVASVLAFVAMISSVLLLYFMLDSWTEGHLFDAMGIGGLSYGQIIASIYLKISISDFLTLFSSRTGEDYFWCSIPSPILLIAAGIALTCSTVIAVTWPPTRPDGIYTVGLGREKPYALTVYIWLYCLAWWVIQDCAKVATYSLIKRYNFFDYNSTGKLILPPSTLSFIEKHKASDLEKLNHQHH
jgi:H+-transporting ATPase